MRWPSCQTSPLVLLFCLLNLFIGKEAVSGFKICSYNLQEFTPQKSANYRMLHTMTRVVSGCDICLLQNVIDPNGKAIANLLTVLNRYNKDHYQSISSKGLGDASNDMQQYVFLYKDQDVKVMDSYQYDSKKVFLRDPFVVRFQSAKTDIKDFILIPLHSNPNNVAKEVDKLYDVFMTVSKKWNNQNVMFLGDFHTACGYLTRADKKKIRLYTDKKFTWLIKDRTALFSNMNSCAYGRFVVSGQEFLKAIKPFSAKVLNIAEEFSLSKAMVQEVSDHIPVMVTLKGSARLLQATPLLILLGVSVVLQFFLSAL